MPWNRQFATYLCPATEEIVGPIDQDQRRAVASLLFGSQISGSPWFLVNIWLGWR